jgi:hypothetical protein
MQIQFNSISIIFACLLVVFIGNQIQARSLNKDFNAFVLQKARSHHSPARKIRADLTELEKNDDNYNSMNEGDSESGDVDDYIEVEATTGAESKEEPSVDYNGPKVITGTESESNESDSQESKEEASVDYNGPKVITGTESESNESESDSSESEQSGEITSQNDDDQQFYISGEFKALFSKDSINLEIVPKEKFDRRYLNGEQDSSDSVEKKK